MSGQGKTKLQKERVFILRIRRNEKDEKTKAGRTIVALFLSLTMILSLVSPVMASGMQEKDTTRMENQTSSGELISSEEKDLVESESPQEEQTDEEEQSAGKEQQEAQEPTEEKQEGTETQQLPEEQKMEETQPSEEQTTSDLQVKSAQKMMLMAPGKSSRSDGDANLRVSWDVKDNDSTVTVNPDESGQATDAVWKAASDKLTISAKIEWYWNISYEKGQAKLIIPKRLFFYRDSSSEGASLSNYTSLKGDLLSLGFDIQSQGDTYQIVNLTKAEAGVKVTITPSYQVDVLKTRDQYTENDRFSYAVRMAMAEKTDNRTITGAVKSAVTDLSVSKEPGGNSTDTTRKGQVFRLNDEIQKTFLVSGNDGLDFTTNYYMQYDVYPAVTGNQPYYVKVSENPTNGTVVAMTYRHSNGSNYALKKLGDGSYVPVSPDDSGKQSFAYEGNSSGTGGNRVGTIHVLVAYPKTSGTVLKNSVSVTVSGVDGDSEDVRTETAEHQQNWLDATTEYRGNVWGIRKWGRGENYSSAETILKNGVDKEVGYYVYGTGRTYVYDFCSNHTDASGPYDLNLIDDAIYLYGKDNQLFQLGKDDYYFKSVEIYVSDNQVKAINESAEPENPTLISRSEAKPVEVWVKRAGNDEWQLYTTVTAGSKTQKSWMTLKDPNDPKWYQTCYSYGTVSFAPEDQVYRIKLKYQTQYSDTRVGMYTTLNIKGNSEQVQNAVSSIANGGSLSLQNWAAIQGYDAAGKWLNIAGEDNITATLGKVSIVNFDHQEYGTENSQCSQRAVETENLNQAQVVVGAAKGTSGKLTISGNNVSAKYVLVASELGKCKTEADAQTLVDAGVLKGSRKAYFYDLLPEGMEYAGYTPISGQKIITDNADSQMTKNYHIEDSMGASSDQNRIHCIAPVSVEVRKTDNYKNTGRQMVEFVLTYDQTPVGTIGYNPGRAYPMCGCVYAIQLNAKSTRTEMGTHGSEVINYFAAQLEDTNENRCTWNASEHASQDNGSYYAENPKIQNAFSDLNEDGITMDYNTVYASHSLMYSKNTTTEIIYKSVRSEDKLENIFGEKAEIPLNGDYTYRLRYECTSGTANDLVIFDTIEQAWDQGYDDIPSGNDEHWEGTLTGVDISEAAADGIPFDVYVNQQTAYKNDDLKTVVDDNGTVTSQGLTKETVTSGQNGWQKVSDPSSYTEWNKVKTIAFVCSNSAITFGSGEGQKATTAVYLKMKGPKSLPDGQTSSHTIYAYNNPAYYSVASKDGQNSIRTTLGNVVKVSTNYTPVEYEFPAILKKFAVGSGLTIPEDYAVTLKFKVSSKPIAGQPSHPSVKPSSTISHTVTKQEISERQVEIPTGKITITKPGTYCYTIYEDTIEGDTNSLMKKDPARYFIKLQAEPIRNAEGIDTLAITSEEIQRVENGNSSTMPKDDDYRTLTSGTKFEFANTLEHSPVSVSVPLYAKKMLTGPLYNNFRAAFTFEWVKTGENQESAPDIREQTVTMTSAGMKETAPNGQITFTKPGSYQYIFREKGGNQTGIQYDQSERLITFTVRIDPSNGNKLEVYQITLQIRKNSRGEEIQNPDEIVLLDEDQGIVLDGTMPITFRNTYQPVPVTVQLPGVTKTISGITPVAPKEFAFAVKAEDQSNPMPSDGKSQVKIQGEGNAQFGNITFDKAGTYTYTIQETTGTEPGYTYDKSQYKLTVTVTDHQGTLEAESVLQKIKKKDGTTETGAPEETVNENTKAAFDNTYTPAPVSAEVNVEKTVTGHERTTENQKEFTFTITGKTKPENVSTYPLPVKNDAAVTSVKVKDNGSASFGTITFTVPGTYTYEVNEESSGYQGYTFDTSKYRLTYQVADTANGSLRVTTSLMKEGSDNTENSIVFRNHYQPSSVTVQLPKITKKISGLAPADQKTFTFALIADQDGNPMPSDGKREVKIQGEGNAQFENITFNKTGIYTYTIKETAGTDHGYTYDQSQYKLTVTVTDDNGTLQAASVLKKIKEADGTDVLSPAAVQEAAFENVYTPDPAAYVVPVSKTVTGHGREENLKKDFTFTIEGVAKPEAVTEFPLPEKEDGTEETSVTIRDTGSASFAPITFTVPGTYSYKVTETNSSKEGYTYDPAEYILSITVQDGTDGKLYIEDSRRKLTKDGEETDAEGNPYTAIAFTNSYQPAPTEAELPGITKTITGVQPQEAKEFTFEILALDEEFPMPETDRQTVTMEGAGDAEETFGPITYTKTGVYRYLIDEVPGTDHGYTYDKSQYELTVTVTDEDGHLKAVSTLKKVTDQNGNEVTDPEEVEVTEETKAAFENVYTPDPAAYTVRLKKTVTGETRKEKEQKDFTFTIEGMEKPKGVDVFPLPEKDGKEEKSVIIKDTGSASFAPMTFTVPGIYTYKVTETNAKYAGYTFDQSEYVIRIAVVDQPDGTLGIDPSQTSLTKNGKVQSEIAFINEYHSLKSESISGKSGKATTGDTSNPLLYLILLLAASVCGGGAVYMRKKNKNR